MTIPQYSEGDQYSLNPTDIIGSLNGDKFEHIVSASLKEIWQLKHRFRIWSARVAGESLDAMAPRQPFKLISLSVRATSVYGLGIDPYLFFLDRSERYDGGSPYTFSVV